MPDQCCERDHDHDGNCDRHPACPDCGAHVGATHSAGCPRLKADDAVAFRTATDTIGRAQATAKMGDTLLCFACDGYRTNKTPSTNAAPAHGHPNGPSMVMEVDAVLRIPQYELDHSARPGIVLSEGPSHRVDVHVLMNTARDASEASGTLTDCPVFERLTESQRAWMRQHAPTGCWAETRESR